MRQQALQLQAHAKFSYKKSNLEAIFMRFFSKCLIVPTKFISNILFLSWIWAWPKLILRHIPSGNSYHPRCVEKRSVCCEKIVSLSSLGLFWHASLCNRNFLTYEDEVISDNWFIRKRWRRRRIPIRPFRWRTWALADISSTRYDRISTLQYVASYKYYQSSEDTDDDSTPSRRDQLLRTVDELMNHSFWNIYSIR